MSPKQTKICLKDSILGFGIYSSLVLGTKLSLNDAVLKRILHIRQHNKLLPNREMCSAVFFMEHEPL